MHISLEKMSFLNKTFFIIIFSFIFDTGKFNTNKTLYTFNI